MAKGTSQKKADGSNLGCSLSDVLKARHLFDHGNVNDIIGKFDDADQLRNAVNQLQSLLHTV